MQGYYYTCTGFLHERRIKCEMIKQTCLSKVALSAIGKAVCPPAGTSFKKYRIVTYLLCRQIKYKYDLVAIDEEAHIFLLANSSTICDISREISWRFCCVFIGQNCTKYLSLNMKFLLAHREKKTSYI